MRKTNTPKPAKLSFDIVHATHESYKLLVEIRDKHHDELEGAKICLAWHKTLKPDVDGKLVLGKCVKVGALQREFMDWDFVIVLNKTVWEDITFTEAKKRALIDHELCHAAEKLDSEGDPKYDEKGRKLWRTRKHDIEEFRAIVRRHGCYKRDLEEFARELLQKTPQLDLIPKSKSPDETTVRFGTKNDKGEWEYTDPITTKEFSELADKMDRKPQ